MKAFFDNGGRRAFIARIVGDAAGDAVEPIDPGITLRIRGAA